MKPDFEEDIYKMIKTLYEGQNKDREGEFETFEEVKITKEFQALHILVKNFWNMAVQQCADSAKLKVKYYTEIPTTSVDRESILNNKLP